VWRIHRAENVEIEQVILNGHGRQQVVNVDEVPIVNRSGDATEGYIVSTAYDVYTEKGRILIEEIVTITGTPVHSFLGCYEASEFTIK
jgi:hypothetical protein